MYAFTIIAANKIFSRAECKENVNLLQKLSVRG